MQPPLKLKAWGIYIYQNPQQYTFKMFHSKSAAEQVNKEAEKHHHLPI